MRINCRDCAGRLTDIQRANRNRPDVCDHCWDNRLWLSHARRDGTITNEQFGVVQKLLYNGRGKARAAIEDLQSTNEGGDDG